MLTESLPVRQAGKFSKYLIYAIGEITLIMIGIFMAFQLQIWNEKKKAETQFKNTLEQLYTTIKYDSETFLNQSQSFEIEVEQIELLLENPKAIPDAELPFSLYLLIFENDFISESLLYAKDLAPHPENAGQKELTKEILNYVSTISNYSQRKDERLEESMKRIDIAIPVVDANLKPEDPNYYNSAEISRCRELLETTRFRAILKSERAINKYNYSNARNRYNDALSIMELIKDYYPELKILYKDVGIIGTAIDGYDDVGAKSTPMKISDINKGIWEINIYLKKGSVKFRCRDSWSQNWGNDETNKFPKGRAVHDGADIPIPEEGNYRVILNLSESTYEFIQQEK